MTMSLKIRCAVHGCRPDTFANSFRPPGSAYLHPTPRLAATRWTLRPFPPPGPTQVNRPGRGIEGGLTEGTEKTQSVQGKSRRPSETVDKVFPATGNPGEAKVDVTVSPVTGETNSTNNHYIYHVAFQS